MRLNPTEGLNPTETFSGIQSQLLKALDTECTVLRKVRLEGKKFLYKKMVRKAKYVRLSNQPRVDSWNRLPLHVDVLLPEVLARLLKRSVMK